MRTYNAHPNTSALLEAWKRLSETPPNAFEGPLTSDYPGIVDRLFILQRVSSGDYSVRSLGDDIQRLVGRDLSDQNFLSLWKAPDRGLVDAALETVLADHGPALIEARGETLNGCVVHLEIALAPLKLSDGKGRTRILGLYQTLSTETVLQDRPIASHKVLSVHAPAPEKIRPILRLVASNP